MSRFLLDTHAFLWFSGNDSRLGKSAISLIADPKNQLFFSPASVWECAIKVQRGRLDLEPDPVQFFEEEAQKNRFQILPIELRHLSPISTLPPHHGDPFDRLLIAQALVEDIPILSRDPQFDAYEGLTRIW